MPGVFGLPKIVIVLGMLVPDTHAVVVAVTLNDPLVNVGDTLNSIVVPYGGLPNIVVPAGTVHV